MAAQDIPFDANLAEFVDDSELTRISSDLVNEIEEDMSSRQDWEDTYKRGIELLGMNYEERSQPFEGASGVVHPLLAESVTQFQAQAYREMLPAGGTCSHTGHGCRHSRHCHASAKVSKIT